MRPHPLLAITSAIFVLGIAGAIGDAATSARTSVVSATNHNQSSTRVTVRADLRATPAVRPLASALVRPIYRTAPTPYLFTPTGRRLRRIHLQLTNLAVAPRSAASDHQWLALRQCESGNNYGLDTGNGYYGAYQFAASTWWGLGYRGLPSAAPSWEQDDAATRLEHLAGWSAWPVCSAAVGL